MASKLYSIIYLSSLYYNTIANNKLITLYSNLNSKIVGGVPYSNKVIKLLD